MRFARLHAFAFCIRLAIGRKYNNRDGEALELRAFAANAPLVAIYLPPQSAPPPPPPPSSTAAFAAAFAAMMQPSREMELEEEAAEAMELDRGSGHAKGAEEVRLAAEAKAKAVAEAKAAGEARRAVEAGAKAFFACYEKQNQQFFL